MISLSVDDFEIQDKLGQLQQLMSDISPVLKVIGEYLQEATLQRFISTEDPDGNAWAVNSEVTLSNKSGKTPLTDDGTLGSSGIDYRMFDADTLLVGSTLEYAAMMQFGGTKNEFPALWGDIPERPLLGLSIDDREEILLILHEAIEKSLK